jgi:hypothetical protein
LAKNNIYVYYGKVVKRNLPQAEDNSFPFIVKTSFAILTIKAGFV